MLSLNKSAWEQASTRQALLCDQCIKQCPFQKHEKARTQLNFRLGAPEGTKASIFCILNRSSLKCMKVSRITCVFAEESPISTSTLPRISLKIH